MRVERFPGQHRPIGDESANKSNKCLDLRDKIGYMAKFASKKVAKRTTKIDVLNSKRYSALTAMLIVSDIEKASNFYQKAFGFKSRGVMKAAGQPIHAELTLRDSTLMLTPEIQRRGARTAKTMGGSSAVMYLLVEDVDKVIDKATALGGKRWGRTEEMFWGDRRGHVIDPDGHDWMIATHRTEYTLKQFRTSKFSFSGGSAACFEVSSDAGDPPPFVATLTDG